MEPGSESAARPQLRSWKEIAVFLGVTERSAQRWEKVAGLPVRRLGGNGKGRVLAYEDELRAWMEAGGAGESGQAQERRRMGAGHLMLGLGLAGVMAGALYWWTRPAIPESYTLNGAELVVRDGRQKVLWAKQFTPVNPLVNANHHDMVLIEDIDQDGQREVLFNYCPRDFGPQRGALKCFDARGRLRWEFVYGAEKTFGGRRFEHQYAGRFLRPVTISGQPYLIVVADHFLWYPGQMALLEARTGKLVAEYWHPGLLQRCLVRDVDGDGAAELVFGAINNPGEGLGHAAVGILKLPFSKGANRQASPNYPPLTGGGEAHYVLLPTSDINHALAKLPLVAELSVDERGGIRAVVTAADAGAIAYRFDAQLNLLEVRYSDGFAPLHRRLKLEGLLDHDFGERERAVLGRVQRFAAAPDGNSEAVQRFWSY